MKILLKFSLSVFIYALCSHAAIAQNERTRDFDETWNGIKDVIVNHRHGTLEIIPGTGSDVKLVAQILVRASDGADAQTLIDHFEINSNAFGDRLEIETKFNTKSWTTTNSNTKIRFSDGTRVTGIKQIQIKYQLFVPALDNLELSNKYNDVEITNDFVGDLKINQYDATIKTKNITGNVEMKLKYGKAYIGEIGDLDLDIYDSNAEIEKAQNLIIKAKYSSIKLGHANSGEIDSYDGYCSIEDVTESLRIVDKYSDYDIGNTRNITVNMYDGKLRLAKAANYSGNSKYSDYSFNEIGTIDLESSHDDQFNIRSVDAISCSESKYTTYEIETIKGKATLTSSYDDEFLVSTVTSAFDHFEIDCKYTAVKLPLTALPGYNIKANMKYGKLSYPQPTSNIVHKENNETLELRAQVGDTNSKAKVIINAYDSHIRLK